MNDRWRDRADCRAPCVLRAVAALKDVRKVNSLGGDKQVRGKEQDPEDEN